MKLGKILKNIHPDLMKSILDLNKLKNDGYICEDTSFVGNSSGGIYYFPLLGGSWKFYGIKNMEITDDQGLHSKFWEKSVLPNVINYYKFSMSLEDKNKLINKLKPYYLSFPRGRIVQENDSFEILHGNELTESFIKTKVIPFFKLPIHSELIITEHEKCYTSHKNIVREILGIKMDWPSIDYFP